MNNQENTKEFCDKVNGVTTVLAVIELMGKKRIICSYASYDRKTKNATVWFYSGQLSKIFERTEKQDSRDPSDVVERYIIGHSINTDVVPFFTEYDLIDDPMDMPSWAARVWLKEQEIKIRKGEFSDGEIHNLKEKMHDIESLITSEESRKITKELIEHGPEEEIDKYGGHNETQVEQLKPPKLVATDAHGNKLFEMYVSPQISTDILRRYVPRLQPGTEPGIEK